jgi:DNA-directed RNA polymerase subunit RPC12/RpoP
METKDQGHPGDRRQRTLSVRVWTQTAGTIAGIALTLGGVYVSVAWRVEAGLLVTLIGLILFGFATNPIRCPNCGHRFPFHPRKPWPNHMPPHCPNCNYKLVVAGVNPPLSALIRTVVFVVLTTLLIGGAIVADRLRPASTVRVTLTVAVGIASVLQFFFIRIFILKD